MPRSTRAAKVLNLTDYLDRRPGQLSGGQRQRVAIGRAIVREPAAFLFDEPLSNLDAALRVNMRLEISELHNQLKTTMIYVTHDQVEAMTMADKIVVLQAGRIEQVGIAARALPPPRQPLRRRLHRQPEDEPDHRRRSREAATPPTIGIRPEHVTLSRDGGTFRGARLGLGTSRLRHLPACRSPTPSAP